MRLTSGGCELDLSPEAFGWLRESNDALDDREELLRRMEADGYLYLPGFLNREDVIGVRQAICRELANDGHLDPDFPVEDGIAREGLTLYFRPDIANNPPVRPLLDQVIYGPQTMSFFTRLLGGKATHYDYTWLRAIAPGLGTYPHCDIVYMGRGTPHLYTAWVPFGDVPLTTGGLVVLEGSHHDREIRENYCTLDVDTACTNRSAQTQMTERGYDEGGAIAKDPAALRARLGYRMLTAKEYRMGDLLAFSVYTVHGSLDNQSRQVRISSDSRYQLASEPLDERWIGEKPPGHGGAMIRDTIC